MKKKALFLTTIMMAVLFVAFSFGGCSEFLQPRQKTLKLTEVYQNSSGDIMLSIANADIIGQEDKVEVSLNGGRSWKECKVENYKAIFYESKKTFFYYNIQEEDYGKNYKISVRIAKDKDKRAGKKSNVIKYKVKAKSDFSKDNGFAKDLFGIIFGEDYFEEYVFVYVDGDIKLCKYYYDDLTDKSEIKPIEKQDKRDFEYMLIDKEEALNTTKQYVEKNITFENQDEVYRNTAIESTSVIFYALDIYAESFYSNNFEWTDYDYSTGITQEDYSAGTFGNINLDSEEIKDGENIVLLAREKESETYTCSDVYVIIVPLNNANLL